MSLTADCHGEFHATDGWIVSPGYPDGYPDDIFCTYRIIQPQKSGITLYFDSINLEHEESCSYDWLEVGSTNYINKTITF